MQKMGSERIARSTHTLSPTTALSPHESRPVTHPAREELKPWVGRRAKDALPFGTQRSWGVLWALVPSSGHLGEFRLVCPAQER